MANLNLKHATRSDIDNVEKYVKNSIEYKNPNLIGGRGVRFAPMTSAERNHKTRFEHLEKILRTFTHPTISVSAYRLEQGEQGFCKYMTKVNGRVDWDIPEVTITFEDFGSLVDQLYGIIFECMFKDGHITIWTQLGIDPKYFPSLRAVPVREHPLDYHVNIGGVPVTRSYFINDQMFVVEKVYEIEDDNTTRDISEV